MTLILALSLQEKVSVRMHRATSPKVQRANCKEGRRTLTQRVRTEL